MGCKGQCARTRGLLRCAAGTWSAGRGVCGTFAARLHTTRLLIAARRVPGGDAATSTMQPLRIAGVPEHYSVPVQLALEEGAIDVTFIEAPGGTGEMMKLLDEGKIDVALSLTEGTVMFRETHPNVEIVSVYASSPLQWGVHVSAKSAYHTAADLTHDVRIAISRFGSGSHLMAYVFAEKRGWDASKLRFVAVGGLSGALKAFEEDTVDLFLWDTYMTSPIVERGQLRRLSVMPSPWPCFVVSSTAAVLRERRAELLGILEKVAQRASRFVSLDTSMERDKSVELLEERYHLSRDNAMQWLTETKFPPPRPLDDTVVQLVKHFMPKQIN